jgi:hypothetical protein
VEAVPLTVAAEQYITHPQAPTRFTFCSFLIGHLRVCAGTLEITGATALTGWLSFFRLRHLLPAADSNIHSAQTPRKHVPLAADSPPQWLANGGSRANPVLGRKRRHHLGSALAEHQGATATASQLTGGTSHGAAMLGRLRACRAVTAVHGAELGCGLWEWRH